MPNPTGDELALLKAVASRPNDDLPRLVYADWLDEHRRGERAEFIRLQIAAESAGTSGERVHWGVEADALLNAHRDVWFRELPRWARLCYGENPGQRVEYRRGFVEQACVIASHYFRFGPQLLDRTPLTRLFVIELKAVRAALADCPWLGRVPRLDLSHERLEEAGASALAGNRHLHGVRELDLDWCGLGDAGVRALAEATSLTGLTKLDLGSNGLTLAAAKALRGARFLRTLTELNLARNPHLRGHEDRIRQWFDGRAVV